MKIRTILALMAVSALLAACGGGGGSSVTDTPAIPTPVVAVPTIADAITELNRLRVSAGANPVTTNVQVMAAAQAHASYLANITTTVSLHVEDPTKPGFTGVTAPDRVLAQGYDSRGTAGEVIDPNAAWQNTHADPLIPLRELMNVPYHGLSLLSGNQDVGMAMVKSNDGLFLNTVINLASKNGAYSNIPLGEVRMWPCNGVDNILHKSATPESPNPIPGRRLDTDPIGTPIYVMVNETKKLVLTTYEIRNDATGQVSVIAKVLGDVVTELAQYERAILPDKPLDINTAYTVTVTGLNDGQPFSKVCKFKTGNLSTTS